MHSPWFRRARRAIRLLRRAYEQTVGQITGVRRQLDRNCGAVALTFDDGPDPEQTPALLDELKRLGVVATFFLVGERARAHPLIVQRIIADGHAVGSHSDSHPEPWAVPFRHLVRDYRQGRAHVEWAAERPVPLFRPPKGYVKGFAAMAAFVARVRPWLWSIDPEDWQPGVRPADILAGLTDLRAGDVVLLHDALEGPLAPSAVDRSATRAALPAIAALAGERGLRFTALT